MERLQSSLRTHVWRGCRRVHTLAEFAACLPQLVPGPHERYPPCTNVPDWARERVAAVMIIETPVDWHQDLQIICDLVRCTLQGTGCLASDQYINVFAGLLAEDLQGADAAQAVHTPCARSRTHGNKAGLACSPLLCV